MPGAGGPVEGDLLGLGEEVRRVRVEHHPPDPLHRRQFLRHDLRRVEQVDPAKVSSGVSGKTCRPSSHSGYAPASIAS
jgi:hypothetical protein